MHVCVEHTSLLKEQQDVRMFIRLPNEPRRVCALSFLTWALSLEPSVFISVYISLSSCVWFSVCVAMCVYSMSAFPSSHHLWTHSTIPPPSLCWFGYSLHLVFMRTGSELRVTLLWPAFILPTLGSSIPFLITAKQGQWYFSRYLWLRFYWYFLRCC